MLTSIILNHPWLRTFMVQVEQENGQIPVHPWATTNHIHLKGHGINLKVAQERQWQLGSVGIYRQIKWTGQYHNNMVNHESHWIVGAAQALENQRKNGSKMKVELESGILLSKINGFPHIPVSWILIVATAFFRLFVVSYLDLYFQHVDVVLPMLWLLCQPRSTFTATRLVDFGSTWPGPLVEVYLTQTMSPGPQIKRDPVL